MKKTKNPYSDTTLESNAWNLGYGTDSNPKTIILNPFGNATPNLKGAWAKGRLALLIDIRPIPAGIYCHGPLIKEGKNEQGLPLLKSPNMCPYWSSDSSKNEQENGFCSFLEIGDWENKKGVFLLWDQVKECGINDFNED